MKKFIGALVVICIVVVLGLVVFVYSGVYNIAATSHHTAPVYWMVNTMTDRSIESHAQGITAPNLEGDDTLRLGLEHYNEMCVTCHGAPGVSPAELASGMYPLPPILSAEPTDMTSSELYWVIKNGIKMTGMPAFGPTHSDDKIWAMVSVVEKLPQWSPEEFAQQVKSVGLEMPQTGDEDESAEHHHDETAEGNAGSATARAGSRAPGNQSRQWVK